MNTSTSSSGGNPTLIDWISLVVIAFAWGSDYILVKKALVVFTPTQLIVLKYIFSSLIVIWIAIKNISKVPKEKLFIIFMITLFGVVIPAYLNVTAQTQLPSSTMGVINALSPVFAVIVSYMFYRNKIKKIQAIGLFIAFCGSVLSSLIHKDGTFGTSFNYYVMFVLVAIFCYSVTAVVMKRRLSDLRPIVIISIGIMFKLPVMVMYFFVFDYPVHVRHVPAEDLWLALISVFLLGTVSMMAGVVLYNRLLFRTSIEFSSTVLYLVTFFAVMWGVIDGEKLFPMNFISMALILIGVVIVDRLSRKDVPHYENIRKFR